MAQTKKEKEAAARKRSEAAQKAAATRKANAEAQESETPVTDEQSQDTPSLETPVTDEGPEAFEADEDEGQTIKVELENHRADVRPDDQVDQHEQRLYEKAAANHIHNARTAGQTPLAELVPAGRKVG